MTAFYQNLGEEIEMMKIQLKDLELEHKYLMKNMEMNAPRFNGVVDYSKDRVTGGQIPLALDEIAGRHDRIIEKSRNLQERIADKQSVMGELQFVMSKKKGLEQQIVYMRDVLGMTLKQIATELGYSYQHIRRVSSGMNKCYNHATIVQHCS
ncbi:sigma factor-like helix-turn-helix DNA-binding protein [Bacillus pseudomycoides]|uniref:sigma factor-like helix-turn-helix DNA-binding protein n=1 Tax=Bacillus pseudomycoides TaxID=64104 RepID=UPI002FFF0C0C